MYHFIGIKGSGMSSLAQIMDSLGIEVQGSDVSKHFFTEEGLIKRGIKVLEFNKENIKEGLIIIQGNAYNEDNNEEVKRAKELNLKILSYQEAVGEITKMFSTICIAGCHGKTTTTAMLSHVLNDIVGCNYLIGDGTGHADKKNKYFVLESCEYKRHFLAYQPLYSIITNIELDHVDYYKDIYDVIDAYQSFINNTTKCAIVNGDDENTRKLKFDKKIIYYGFKENNNVIAKNVEYSEDGTEFNVYIDGKFIDRFKLKLYGEHMLLNSLAVITLCYLENIDLSAVKSSLQTFKGAKRRFTETKILDNVVIDDYAHHPTEVQATINSAKQKYPNKKIVAVFEPHTFSRTIRFHKELIEVLKKCDKVFVMDIYGAREKQENYPGITYHIIADGIKNSENINRNEAYKLKGLKNAVILFMSPNDLSSLENEYIKLKENE